MKLLFDQNLSWRLPAKLSDLYPDSQHIREVGMTESQDVDVWNYAKANGFVIVSKDLDFQQRSLLLGPSAEVCLVARRQLSDAHDRRPTTEAFCRDSHF